MNGTDLLNYAVPALVLAMVAVIGYLAAQLMGKAKREKELAQRMAEVEKLLGAKLEESRDHSDAQARKSREELSGNLKGMSDSVTRVMSDMARTQIGQMDTFAQQLREMARTDDERMNDMRRTVEERLLSYEKRMDQIGDILDSKLEKSDDRLEKVRSTLDDRLRDLEQSSAERLSRIEQTNAEKLTSIEHTVDERLNATLDRRLGESFRSVSDRLDQVYAGLGEMQELASGVGDLKRVLTGVRARGQVGEIQLEALLKQILSEEQYVAPFAGRGAQASAAIRMPGRSSWEKETYLPIDADFSLALYSELLDAADAGDAEAQERVGKALEEAALAHARQVSQQLIAPPETTDFAVMFVPGEGAYAELLKRQPLMEALQRDYHVMLTGPTTLTALLNSLHMGFQSIALERRSEEVWGLLGAMKEEFIDFADALAKTQKRIRQASESIEDATRRSRTLQKKLKKVDLPGGKRRLEPGDDGRYDMGDWD
ncbi:MAG: DNA recombination protein RmuC [Clostridia bacterium]|nr:DNA recombination protein RmuC [Clostridia bacterium]